MTDYHQLVETQRSHFKTGAPAKLAARRERLTALKKLIDENHTALCDAVYKDIRRQPNTTYLLELTSTIAEIAYMLDHLSEWAAPTYVEKTLLTLLDTPMIVKEPVGVVLIIAPWNFPLNMVTLPLTAALAAGNTAIIKPSELAPATSAVWAQLIPKYFKPTEVAVVEGGVQETTKLLTERFDHIMYTGCPPVAKIIMAAAAKHLTPVTLELGGKNPTVVLDDADIPLTARRIAWGKWLNCGQVCLSPDYVLCSEKVRPALVAGLQESLKTFYGKDIRSSPDYSRIINERHFDRIVSVLDKTKGVVLFQGGEPDRTDRFIPPHVLQVKRDDELMLDEIFGPILPILTVSGLDEAIEIVKAHEKPLAAYIFTRSEEKVQRFLTETSSGAVTVNDVIMHLSVDTLPFGGVGNSGMGRYRGKHGFDTFTHEKAVLKRAFLGDSLISFRYPPATDAKYKQMKWLTSTRKEIPRTLLRVVPTLPFIIVSFIFGIIYQAKTGRDEEEEEEEERRSKKAPMDSAAWSASLSEQLAPVLLIFVVLAALLFASVIRGADDRIDVLKHEYRPAASGGTTAVAAAAAK